MRAVVRVLDRVIAVRQKLEQLKGYRTSLNVGGVINSQEKAGAMEMLSVANLDRDCSCDDFGGCRHSQTLPLCCSVISTAKMSPT